MVAGSRCNVGSAGRLGSDIVSAVTENAATVSVAENSAIVELAVDTLRSIVETAEVKAALLVTLSTVAEAPEMRIGATLPLLWTRLDQQMKSPFPGDVLPTITAVMVVIAADLAEKHKLIQADDACCMTAIYLLVSLLTGDSFGSRTLERCRFKAAHEVSPLIPTARALWRQQCEAAACVRSLH